MNPDKSNRPASDPWLRSTVGHELTHAMHRNAGNSAARAAQNYAMYDDPIGLPNVFKGHESKFPEHLRKPGGAGVGNSGDQRSRLDYFGNPTEFGAYLSELRRYWIANNPGKALDNIPAAAALLHHYNPARDNEERFFEMTVPDNDISYTSTYPRSPTSDGDLYKTFSPEARVRRRAFFEKQYNHLQKAFQNQDERKASGVPDGYKKMYLDLPDYEPVPQTSPFQELLPTIMSDPELKKRAILQILSSVVQNKQRQAPGTNV